MTQPMNVALQRRTIERRLKARGVDLSTVDLTALIDPTLTLPENIRNIEQEIGQQQRRTTRAQGRAQSQEQVRRRATRLHRQRPRWNRRIDEGLDARITFADPTPRQLQKWRENPNRFDIMGVDTKRDRDARTQARNPAVVRQRARSRLKARFSLRSEDLTLGRQLQAQGTREERLAGKRIEERAEQELARLGDKFEKLDTIAPTRLMKGDMKIV